MDYKFVEQLLEKYFAAETSLEEERVLRDCMTLPGLPQHLARYADLFLYDIKLLDGEVLMMDDLYKELNSRCTRTDFTVEERKLDGKTFTVEVYPAKDYTEQAAFYFDKDGQLVHVLVGTKDTPLVGESFFTVDPPDGKVDEKLFTTDGYTLE